MKAKLFVYQQSCGDMYICNINKKKKGLINM